MTTAPQRELPDYIADIFAQADIPAGPPLVLGTQESDGGGNFAIFSSYASCVRLELFDHPEDDVPTRTFPYSGAGGFGQQKLEFKEMVQIKNFLLTLFVPRGVPMLLGGDEFRRTQRGNNNTYCQDNETSWMDLSHLEQHQEICRFTQGMIAFRREHPVLSKEEFFTDAEIQWLGSHGRTPQWLDSKENHFACLIHEEEQRSLGLLFNAGGEAVDFHLPPMPDGAQWHVAVDTSRETPRDLFATGEEPFLECALAYLVRHRSSVMLLSKKTTL